MRSSGVSSPRSARLSRSRCGAGPGAAVCGRGGGGGGSARRGGEGGASGSRRWKLRWHPHAAHLSEAGSAGSAAGDGMNSPHPSTACPPRLAAWFLRHSRYIGSPAAGATAAGFTFLTAPPLGNMSGLYLTSMASMPPLALTGRDYL
uniref:Uncharacterized protein n=1 Tax=Arundo donax TaxID=35708 RepID=A0A0A9D5A6_ARUDO